MRITAEAKTATRQRILEVAEELFRTKGFEATTTRDIAQAAEIATGTLFNYVATKEAIVTELAAESLDRARGEFDKQAAETETLDEALFALVAVELRQLRPFRKYILPMLETAFCPLAAAERNAPGEELRRQHLETVAGLARRHGLGDLSPVALQIYWTLYTGVLAFWAADKSPKQEDTLALLDESLAMFVAWLRTGADDKK
jgi:AcrR family transcriptional regulator